jgi:predicted dienelactone hydrolase
MKRRSFLIATAAGAALPAAAAMQDLTWTDAARARTVPLRVRWPDGNAPCALVLHSHGLGGNRDGGDVWGDAWRTAGVAVIHLQHPGSDTDAVRGGRRALRDAFDAQQLLARAADMRYVLDEIARRAQAGEPGFSRVRLDAVGASGHSFGARTVQALAGQRFAASLGDALSEPRFKAFVAFSPSPGGEQFGANGAFDRTSSAFDRITRPFLCVTGSRDGDPLGEQKTGDYRAAVYDSLPSGQRALLWLDGADHMTFGGNAAQRIGARAGPLRREREAVRQEDQDHALVATVTTAWWREHLLGDASARRTPTLPRAGDRWRRD